MSIAIEWEDWRAVDFEDDEKCNRCGVYEVEWELHQEKVTGNTIFVSLCYACGDKKESAKTNKLEIEIEGWTQ